jgi:DNA-directed RNA polymerase specialized sigma24 family protein
LRSDEELMLDVAQGDLPALEQLVRRHQAAAFHVAYRLLGHADDAEDVA